VNAGGVLRRKCSKDEKNPGHGVAVVGSISAPKRGEEQELAGNSRAAENACGKKRLAAVVKPKRRPLEKEAQ